MKKIIGIVLIGIFALNVIGYIYLSANNPDKISNNSDYFAKKIGFAALFGALGLFLLLSGDDKNKATNANLLANNNQQQPRKTDYSGSSYSGGYTGGHNSNENNSQYNPNNNNSEPPYQAPPNHNNNNNGGEYNSGDLYK